MPEFLALLVACLFLPVSLTILVYWPEVLYGLYLTWDALRRAWNWLGGDDEHGHYDYHRGCYAPRSSNGRTTDFESVNGGSNPPRGSKKKDRREKPKVSYAYAGNSAAAIKRRKIMEQLMKLIQGEMFDEGGLLHDMEHEDLGQRVGSTAWQAERLRTGAPYISDLAELVQAADLDLGIIVRDSEGHTREFWPEMNFLDPDDRPLVARKIEEEPKVEPKPASGIQGTELGAPLRQLLSGQRPSSSEHRRSQHSELQPKIRRFNKETDPNAGNP